MSLVLGTAQLGRNYGVSNVGGKVKYKDALSIVKLMQRYGYDKIDTSSDYGDSEQIIGKIMRDLKCNLKITTKIFGIDDPNFVFDIVSKSMKNLDVECIDTVLMHSPDKLLGSSGDGFFRKLSDLVDSRIINKIGVSAFYQSDVRKIINAYPISAIQIPCSVFDQRFVESGLLDELIQKNITVYLRSIFLQGLCFVGASNLPEMFNPIKHKFLEFYGDAKNNSYTPLDLALGYVKCVGGDCNVVVGFDNLKQAAETIGVYNKAAVDIDYAKYKIDDINYTNPSKWNVGGWL